MSIAQQLENLVKPISPEPGQAYLFLDLTEIPNSLDALKQIESEGYTIQLRLQECPSGIHMIAVLREEENVSDERYDALRIEWANLTERFGEATHLRRKPASLLPLKRYPFQHSVHDWTVPGTPVWTDTQGYLCPELETPRLGESVIYVDYEKDSEASLIQADVELAIDALGYPAGSRWIGRSALDVDNVVSYVGTVKSDEVKTHLEKLQKIVPLNMLVCVDGTEI